MDTTWTTSEEIEIEGNLLSTGCLFKCRGERGKTYRFIRFVTTEKGEAWVDCHGGSTGYGQFRSLRLDSIAPDSIKKPKKVE